MRWSWYGSSVTPRPSRCCERLAADAPAASSARAALELATIELERNQPDAALTTLESALKRFPESPLLPAMHFRLAEVFRSKTIWRKPRRNSNGWSRPIPTIPGPTTRSSEPPRRRSTAGDLKEARRLAGTFEAAISQSPLRFEVRLIEARAAALEGQARRGRRAARNHSSTRRRTPAKSRRPLSRPPQPGRPLRASSRLIGPSGSRPWPMTILASLAKEGSGPVAADAQFLIGQSHLAAGRYAEAVPPLEAYLTTNPRGEVADVALAHLAAARLGSGQARRSLEDTGRRSPSDSRRARLWRRPVAPGRGRAGRASGRASRRAVPAGCRPGGPGASRPDQPAANRPTRRTRPENSSTGGPGKVPPELGKPADAAAAFATVRRAGPRSIRSPRDRTGPGRALEAGKQIDAALKSYSLVLEKFAKSDQSAAGRPGASPPLRPNRSPRSSSQLRIDRLIGDRTPATRCRQSGVTPDVLLVGVGMGPPRCRQGDRSRPGFRPVAQGLSQQVRTPPTPASTWPSRPTWRTTMPRWSGC